MCSLLAFMKTTMSSTDRANVRASSDSGWNARLDSNSWRRWDAIVAERRCRGWIDCSERW